MKTILKNNFQQSQLAKLTPGDSILVLCSSYKETESCKQIAYNAIRREPRDDVSKYKVDRDLENNSVLITAMGVSL